MEPDVAGKPQPPLFEETVRRVGGDRPLVVGDRLDTDIEGAVDAGLDSLLVLTGVTGLAELVAARPGRARRTCRRTSAGSREPHRGARASRTARACVGGWTASVGDGSLHVEGEGEAADWWRAVAVAAWAHLDETGAARRRVRPGAAGLTR